MNAHLANPGTNRRHITQIAKRDTTKALLYRSSSDRIT
jgi:hypothetical protein